MIADTCVRCGAKGRYAGSWLCEGCYRDPARLVEQRAVETLPHHDARQRLRTEFGWAGWGSRDMRGQ